jgi:hypothetical protein
MPNPAFLVDGQMEQRIIQKLCQGQPVRLIGCNGDDVSMAAVAKALNANIRMLKRYYPIVIVLDRERRTQSTDELITELSLLLDNYGHQGRYVIGMTDRTIENWILADWGHICSQMPGHEELQGHPEACHGKSVLKKLMPPNVLYHETTIGVELFLKCRPNEIQKASRSFQAFVSKINFGCYWLRNIGNDANSAGGKESD